MYHYSSTFFLISSVQTTTLPYPTSPEALHFSVYIPSSLMWRLSRMCSTLQQLTNTWESVSFVDKYISYTHENAIHSDGSVHKLVVFLNTHKNTSFSPLPDPSSSVVTSSQASASQIRWTAHWFISHSVRQSLVGVSVCFLALSGRLFIFVKEHSTVPTHFSSLAIDLMVSST